MYCPNCSASHRKGEGFCPVCGWRFGGECGLQQVRETAPRRMPARPLYDFKYYHWDFMHVGQRQFPVGRW